MADGHDGFGKNCLKRDGCEVYQLVRGKWNVLRTRAARVTCDNEVTVESHKAIRELVGCGTQSAPDESSTCLCYDPWAGRRYHMTKKQVFDIVSRP